MSDVGELGQAFVSALADDGERIRELLSEDVEFTGPLADTSGIVQTTAGLVEMSAMVTAVSADALLADDANVLIWTTMTTRGQPALPAAIWLRVNGERKISEIRTVFAAR